MTTLADLLDPDQWIASGRSLMDFPWPAKTENEREAVKLVLADHPQLAAHLGRWGSRLAEVGRGRSSEKVGDVLTEQQVRELWNETRAAALS
jgi:hypothetical protein